MKKNLLRALACGMALFMGLSLAACSGNDASSAANSSSASSSVESAASDPASEPASEAADGGLTASGKFASIEDFVNSDEMQSQLSEMLASMGDSLDIDVRGEGNKLVYEFRYPEGTATDGLAAQLEEALSSLESTYTGIATSLKDAVEVENPVVVVTYAESDGTVIYSQEFPAA